MKKLTKKQRHEIYKKAHAFINGLEFNESYHMCLLLKNIYELGNINGCTDSDLLFLFPEFSLFKPYENAYAWFNNQTGFTEHYSSTSVKEAQKTIFEFCIEMTK